jgi:hypothetical protein
MYTNDYIYLLPDIWNDIFTILRARFVKRKLYFKKFVFSQQNGDPKKTAKINKECYMVYRQMAAVSSFFAPLPLAGVLCVFMVEREVFH